LEDLVKRFQRSAAFVVAALLPAFLVTACAHGAGTSSVPSVAAQDQTRSPLDKSTSDLHAGGASFPFVFYTGNIQPTGAGTSSLQPLPVASALFGSTYGGAAVGHNIYYCSTGSGYGKNTLTGVNNASGNCAALGSAATGFGARNAQPDFVGSDAALTTTDYTNYTTNKTTQGQPVEVPFVAGAIGFPYQTSDLNGLSGGAKLQLSKATYCKIANGTITNWNDAAIKSDNGGTYVVDTTQAAKDGSSFTAGAAGQSVLIRFVFRSDSSGTSLLFQNHLKTVCGSDWTNGTATAWKGTAAGTGGFSSANGNPGVTNAVANASTGHYSTGYIEAGFINYSNPGSVLSVAQLKGPSNTTYVDPLSASALTAAVNTITLSSFTMGGSDNNDGGLEANLGTSRKDCVFHVNPNKFADPTATDTTAYPIIGLTYLDFYGAGNVHFSGVTSLFTFLSGGSVTALPSPPTGYALLVSNSAIKTEYQAAINGTSPSSSLKDFSGASVTRSSTCIAS
jgi:phosphate transport system substrate-binding protein